MVLVNVSLQEMIVNHFDVMNMSVRARCVLNYYYYNFTSSFDLKCISLCMGVRKFPFPPSAGLYELLAALPSQLQPHVSRPEDNAFLQDMFGERSFHSLVKVKQTKKKCLS